MSCGGEKEKHESDHVKPINRTQLNVKPTKFPSQERVWSSRLGDFANEADKRFVSRKMLLDYQVRLRTALECSLVHAKP